jgi:hypothetical protein
LAKSEGLFLYVEAVRQELANGRLSLNRLDQFPQGLGGVYVAFFARQFPDVPAYEANVRPALEAVCAARNPMRVCDLAAMFRWDDYQRKRALDSLGSLFPVFDDCVQPFHQSVKDWLSDEGKAGPYFVSEKAGHERLANFCWSQYELGAGTMSEFAVRFALFHLRQVGADDRAGKIETDREFNKRRFELGLRKIYICYAWREGREFARRLEADLMANGHQVWDPTTELRAGQNWEMTVGREIVSADNFIAVLTPGAVRPEGFCLQELVQAFEHGLRTIPVMLQDCTPPLLLYRQQWLDMRGWQSSDRYQHGLRVLLDILGDK